MEKRDEANFVKVTVPLGSNEWHGFGSEGLWAVECGLGQFELRSVPFYAFGLSFADIVSAERNLTELVVTGVVRKGRHSTYRVILSDPERRDLFDTAWSGFAAEGCTYERATEAMIGIDVPPESDIYRIYDLLESWSATGLWDFEEGDCGHPPIGNRPD